MKTTSRIRGTRPELDESAVMLRHSQTPAEAALWKAIRGRQVGGCKFRRQHPIGPYILDFYCAEKKLAIELDGAVHDEQVDYDADRTAHLNAFGIRVTRFRNSEVLRNLAQVIATIAFIVDSDSLTRASPPLPALGEGVRAKGAFDSPLQIRYYWRSV